MREGNDSKESYPNIRCPFWSTAHQIRKVVVQADISEGLNGGKKKKKSEVLSGGLVSITESHRQIVLEPIGKQRNWRLTTGVKLEDRDELLFSLCSALRREKKDRKKFFKNF